MNEVFHWCIEIGLLVISLVLWVQYSQKRKSAHKWFEHACQLEALMMLYEIKYREQVAQIVTARKQL